MTGASIRELGPFRLHWIGATILSAAAAIRAYAERVKSVVTRAESVDAGPPALKDPGSYGPEFSAEGAGLYPLGTLAGHIEDDRGRAWLKSRVLLVTAAADPSEATTLAEVMLQGEPPFPEPEKLNGHTHAAYGRVQVIIAAMELAGTGPQRLARFREFAVVIGRARLVKVGATITDARWIDKAEGRYAVTLVDCSPYGRHVRLRQVRRRRPRRHR